MLLSGVSLQALVLQFIYFETGAQGCYWPGLGSRWLLPCSVIMGGGALRLYVSL